jgi:hypothetical protein
MIPVSRIFNPMRLMQANNRLEKDLRPARFARWSRPLSLIRSADDPGGQRAIP